MEEMFEYLVPLQGFFKKRRSPKAIEAYRKLDDFDKIAEDFKIAKSYLSDAVRIGQYCVFRKDKVSIFYIKDIVKACFRVHGSDATDEYGTIDLLFRDGSEEILYNTPETDGKKVMAEVSPALNAQGIETVILNTR